jgi:transposase
MMLKIITYGYCTGCFSSRRLEAKLREDLAFIYLASGHRQRFWGAIDFVTEEHIAKVEEMV